jgi:hypothetical protein
MPVDFALAQHDGQEEQAEEPFELPQEQPPSPLVILMKRLTRYAAARKTITATSIVEKSIYITSLY